MKKPLFHLIHLHTDQYTVIRPGIVWDFIWPSFHGTSYSLSVHDGNVYKFTNTLEPYKYGRFTAYSKREARTKFRGFLRKYRKSTEYLGRKKKLIMKRIA